MIRRADRELAEVIPQGAERPRSPDVVWEGAAIGREQREERHGHRAAVLWFTGLSGAGKSTWRGCWRRDSSQRAARSWSSTATTCATG